MFTKTFQKIRTWSIHRCFHFKIKKDPATNAPCSTDNWFLVLCINCFFFALISSTKPNCLAYYWFTGRNKGVENFAHIVVPKGHQRPHTIACQSRKLATKNKTTTRLNSTCDLMLITFSMKLINSESYKENVQRIPCWHSAVLCFGIVLTSDCSSNCIGWDVLKLQMRAIFVNKELSKQRKYRKC